MFTTVSTSLKGDFFGLEMKVLTDTKYDLAVVDGIRFFMSGHRPVQVVDTINLESYKRGFTPLDSPVSSSNDDAPLPMHALDQFQMKEVRLRFVILSLANPSNHARP